MEEMAKYERSGQIISWDEVAKVLNAEGPCLKSGKSWKLVKLEL